MMARATRLKILLGACIIGMIGMIVHSNLLFGGAVLLLLFSGIRYPQSTPTNYTEKFGPPDPSGLPEEGNRTPFTDLEIPEDQDTKE